MWRRASFRGDLLSRAPGPIRPVVAGAGAVTLVGGGRLGRGDLDLALARAPVLVAADGGADAALEAGHVPRAVIGDLDSLSPGARERLGADRIVRVDEQDSTDFEKCLARIDAPLILGAGFLGGRVDHAMAALGALVRARRPCVLLGEADVVAHCAGALALDLPAGCRVSLFPMAPVTGRSEGLDWPIDGLDFAPGGRIGTSNRATGPVRIAMDGPGMLLILPRDRLDALLAALLSSSGR